MVLSFVCLYQAANNELNGWLVRLGSEVPVSLFKFCRWFADTIAAPVYMDRCSKDCNGRNQCEEAIWEKYVNTHNFPCMQFSMQSCSILYVWSAIHCNLLQFAFALRTFVIHCDNRNDLFWILVCAVQKQQQVIYYQV